MTASPARRLRPSRLRAAVRKVPTRRPTGALRRSRVKLDVVQLVERDETASDNSKPRGCSERRATGTVNAAPVTSLRARSVDAQATSRDALIARAAHLPSPPAPEAQTRLSTSPPRQHAREMREALTRRAVASPVARGDRHRHQIGARAAVAAQVLGPAVARRRTRVVMAQVERLAGTDRLPAPSAGLEASVDTRPVLRPKLPVPLPVPQVVLSGRNRHRDRT